MSKNITYLDNLDRYWYDKEAIDVKKIEELIEKFRPAYLQPFAALPIYFIIDYTNKQYLLLTEAIKNILGYHPKEFIETKLDKLVQVFHKEDFLVFNNQLFPSSASFLASIPFSEHRNHVFSYNFRVLASNKMYAHMLQYCTYITCPETGLPMYSIGYIMDITLHKANCCMIQTVQKIDSYSRKTTVLQNFYYPDEEETVFSTRETEIAKYLVDGFSSKQIAHKLRISENTVSNHRQNMLRKANAKNVAEMIAYIANKKLF